MNYYNEHDPNAAAWLRELINAGVIPPGQVDTRSIIDVQAHELTPYAQCHFFAGIGGWSYALALAGWPADRPVWTGSCPCQPFSAAGQGMGEADPRHLWPVFRNLIGQCRPPVVFGEQVASSAGLRWIDGVCLDLEAAGYACGAADLCAASVGAPHIRQRLYWVADATGEQWNRRARVQGENRRTRLEAGGGRVLTHGPGRDTREPTPTPMGHGSAAIPAGGDGRMDHAASARRDGPLADAEVEARNQTRLRVPGAASGPGGLANPAGVPGPEQRIESRQRSGAGPQDTSECGSPGGGLGDPIIAGLEGQSGHEHDRGKSRWHDSAPGGPVAASSGASDWARFDILPCADGKARRVESGTFPLAHGIPGRVGLLRGYGNAIVPQVAARFIQAYTEVTP